MMQPAVSGRDLPPQEGMMDCPGWLERLAGRLTELDLLPGNGAISAVPLTGGVSSDIWLVGRGGRKLVVKRALSRLRVEQEWRAPVGRNAAEADWFDTVHAILPDAVPKVLHRDEAAGLFVMSYVPPEAAPVWKAQLLAGTVDPDFAAQVGRALGRIHDATAGRPDITARFANAQMFHALRLAPYMEATAERYPALAARIGDVQRQTETCRMCLIHGDVSPKNILIGARGPIFLDAECATFGDPAFDLAFCLNHLLLKGFVVAGHAALAAAFSRLTEAYFSSAGFARRDDVEARAAALLPVLFLARVDGKSPVEYVTRDSQRALVRRAAREWLDSPGSRLQTISDAWQEALRGATE